MLLAFAVTSVPLAKQSTVCRKQRVPNPLTSSAQEGVGQHMGKALAEGSAPTLLSSAELWNRLSLLCQAVALGWQLQGRETPLFLSPLLVPAAGGGHCRGQGALGAAEPWGLPGTQALLGGHMGLILTLPSPCPPGQDQAAHRAPAAPAAPAPCGARLCLFKKKTKRERETFLLCLSQ